MLSSSSDDEYFGNLAVYTPPKKSRYVLDNTVPDSMFRNRVLVMLHRLNVPKWKGIPPAHSNKLIIKRLSGALTNAVYFVAPPENVDAPKLLLRIYGPNASLFIDRTHELANLRRLARHKIGPYLLGEFANGRFEQWLDSITLTRDLVRDPVLSIFIARRLCEMHFAVTLSEHELHELPTVWHNWFKWLPPAREAVKKLRKPLPTMTVEAFASLERDFAAYYQWYLQWSSDKKQWPVLKLVFCHNDSQYGNILKRTARRRALRSPAAAHRVLVPVDFEYAGPNPRAFDIANHFAEWMANYHHPTHSYAMDSGSFPTVERRQEFYQAYAEQDAVLNHKLTLYDAAKLSTDLSPELRESIETYMQQCEAAMRAIMPSVHATWALWGILQHIEDENDEWVDVVDGSDTEEHAAAPASTENAPKEHVPPIGSSDFNYLGYSDAKLNLFYQCCASLGLESRGRDEFPYNDISKQNE